MQYPTVVTPLTEAWDWFPNGNRLLGQSHHQSGGTVLKGGFTLFVAGGGSPSKTRLCDMAEIPCWAGPDLAEPVRRPVVVATDLHVYVIGGILNDNTWSPRTWRFTDAEDPKGPPQVTQA